MRFNRLDLNLLVCLDALIAEKSVSKAAERVFLGQPAMSSALGRLREHFGDEILVKIGRSMVLSPLARSLARPVRDILLQTQAVTSVRPDFDPAKSERKISVVASDYVANVFMTALLPRFWSLAPRMKLELRSMGVRFQEEFDSGEVDMMIVPDSLLAKEHPSEILFDDTFSCVVWSGNPLARKALSARQYLSMGHVGTQWGAGRLITLDEQALQRRGQFRRIEIVVPDFSLAPQMVVGTHRIATVQTRLARLMAQRWPLKVLPCPVPLPRLVEAAQWHKYVDRDPAIIWFRALLKTVAAQLSLPFRNKTRPRLQT
jgi:LysR family transcriptional regulator, nod-box dependent transcriptional activator